MTTTNKEVVMVREKLTLEQVQARLTSMEYDRQHGRAGKSLANADAEKKRLINNLKSRESRARYKSLQKSKEKTYDAVLNPKRDEDNKQDEAGITPKQRRIWEQTFASCKCYYGYTPRHYLKMMTGLTLGQIGILQKETGQYPVPRVKDAEIKEAELDDRW
jgi:hypothetical protein